MINPIFGKKNSFVVDYFEKYFKQNKRFPQSIVFESADTLNSYFFAVELARILNCEKEGDINCNCTNCSWIKSGKHPSVMNVSPVDFKEDLSKTVISVKQIEKITSMINEASSYHRFFIFSGAKMSDRTEFQNKKIEEYKKEGFLIENEEWYPNPLNRKIMQEESSNALLKCTEEAPDNVCFIFLTDSKENIIQTITSRSFIFKLPYELEKNNVSINDFFDNYPNLKLEDCLSKIETLSNEKEILNILDSMQDYLLELLKQNPNLGGIIISDIKKIETAKAQIQALVSPKNAMENLAICLSLEGRNL